MLLLLSVCLSHSEARAQVLLPTVPIGKAAPESVCSRGSLTLTPPDGSTGFPAARGDLNVYFAPCALAGKVTSWSNSAIVVEVPESAVSGPLFIASQLAVTRKTLNGAANRAACVGAGISLDMLGLDGGIVLPPPRPRPELPSRLSPPAEMPVILPAPVNKTDFRIKMPGGPVVPRGVGQIDPRTLQRMCTLPMGHCDVAPPTATHVTIMRAPKIADLGIDPGWAISDTELAASEVTTHLHWTIRGAATTTELLDLDTNQSVPLGGAQDYQLKVERQMRMRLMASNASCPGVAPATREVTLTPAFVFNFRPDIATVPPNEQKSVDLVLSRPPPLGNLRFNFTKTRIDTTGGVLFSAPSGSVFEKLEATVEYALRAIIQPGTILATAPPGIVTATPIALFTALPAPPPPGSALVQGVIEYEDCSSTGAQGTFSCAGAPFRPAREVEIWVRIPLRAGSPFPAEYVKGVTNDFGEFRIALPDLTNPRYQGSIDSHLEIHIPTKHLLIVSTLSGIVFSGAVQPTFYRRVDRGTQPIDNLRLRVRGADASFYNAYDNILASTRYLDAALGPRDLHRMVITTDWGYCLGGIVHTQQIPDWNTLLCGNDPATLFDDRTVRHEYGHHVQHIMGQWRPWPSYHDGCESRNPFHADAPLANNPEMAWFEGFPSLFADRVREQQKLPGPPLTRFCVAVGGPFCRCPAGAPACANVCTAGAFCRPETTCSAVGKTSYAWERPHTITPADVEDYVAAVLLDAIEQGGLSDEMLMKTLWNDLRGKTVTLQMFSDSLPVGDLIKFMKSYGMM